MIEVSDRNSFGATTALTYAALFPESTAACVAVAAFGIGPDADAQEGGEAESEADALLARHAGSPWYEAARPVLDQWTERLLAATEAAEMEGCGHIPSIEAPQEYRHAVVGFLRS